MPAMIKGWRDKWNIGNFPFYSVQIAPFHYGTGEFGPFIVESQVEILKIVENTGLATTTDIGKCKDIHPPEKKLIGNRLAYWALAKDYDFESISYKGPVYESMKVFDKNRVRIHFEKSDRDRGLTNKGLKLPEQIKSFIQQKQ